MPNSLNAKRCARTRAHLIPATLADQSLPADSFADCRIGWPAEAFRGLVTADDQT